MKLPSIPLSPSLPVRASIDLLLCRSPASVTTVTLYCRPGARSSSTWCVEVLPSVSFFSRPADRTDQLDWTGPTPDVQTQKLT